MTADELQQIKVTLAELRKQTPLGFNDSETAIDCADLLVAEVERLRNLFGAAAGAVQGCWEAAITTKDEDIVSISEVRPASNKELGIVVTTKDD